MPILRKRKNKNCIFREIMLAFLLRLCYNIINQGGTRYERTVTAMARTDLIKYIRTDKNGTKIFYDYTCPRCCGYGMLDKWINTGRVCYECGGSGVRKKAKIVKEYTDEYIEKLQARREERAKKYAEEHADEIAAKKAEQERRESEWRKHENERTCSQNGFGTNGVGFILTGKTYPVKDEIKANGGKWIYGVWVCPVEIKAKGVCAKRVEVKPNEYGFFTGHDIGDAIFDATER